MTRRERILKSVLKYNEMCFLEHVRKPINVMSDQRMARLKRTIIALNKRLGKKPVYDGQTVFDFDTSPNRSLTRRMMKRIFGR